MVAMIKASYSIISQMPILILLKICGGMKLRNDFLTNKRIIAMECVRLNSSEFEKWQPGMPLTTESGTYGVVDAYFGWMEVAAQIMRMQEISLYRASMIHRFKTSIKRH